jgi:hypothetical protein
MPHEIPVGACKLVRSRVTGVKVVGIEVGYAECEVRFAAFEQ